MFESVSCLATVSMRNFTQFLKNEILRERRAITPTMALRLSRLFGNSPEFWLKAQHASDLWDFEQRFHNELAQIQPLTAA
ncbi:MAG: HigA family addiction module antidote protein [Deltaproteobacteria bacterium]|nr:HigA family addiction module antidote protein [Deltaproteobacteria bacterium]